MSSFSPEQIQEAELSSWIDKCHQLEMDKEALIEACKKARIALLDAYGVFGGGHKVNDVFDILNKALDNQ